MAHVTAFLFCYASETTLILSAIVIVRSGYLLTYAGLRYNNLSGNAPRNNWADRGMDR